MGAGVRWPSFLMGTVVDMRKRLFSLIMALSLCVGCCLAPVAAYADDDLGDVDAPNVPASSQEVGSTTEGITVSADNAAATLDGCAFALSDFKRAQTGSNREVEGAYHGYTFLEGSTAYSTCLVATSAYAVVYVDASVAAQVGCDVSSAESRAALGSLLTSLDDANASGGATLDSGATYYITSDASYTVNGVTYLFNQELSAGHYYTCVIGADGSDITDTANPSYVKTTHASFAQLVPSGEATIVAQPTAWESLCSFLSTLDYSPLWVTLRTTLTAIVFIFVLGLAAAYFCLRIPTRARDIFDAIFTIPMVLPPTVCGFLLLLCLGNNTAVGRWFIDIGFPLIFSWPATVIAAVVVAFPLMYRSARGAFESLDPNMLDAARTLGWSNARVFFRLMLPLSWSNIASGTVLAFARALGEFGATLFLAGNYLGVTRTIPIAIYFEWMNGNTDVAIFWTIVIMIFSFIVILFINLWDRHTTRYRKGAIEK